MSTENAGNPLGTVYCGTCGEQNPAKGIFCWKCGKSLIKNASQVGSQQKQQGSEAGLTPSSGRVQKQEDSKNSEMEPRRPIALAAVGVLAMAVIGLVGIVALAVIATANPAATVLPSPAMATPIAVSPCKDIVARIRSQKMPMQSFSGTSDVLTLSEIVQKTFYTANGSSYSDPQWVVLQRGTSGCVVSFTAMVNGIRQDASTMRAENVSQYYVDLNTGKVAGDNQFSQNVLAQFSVGTVYIK